MKKLDIHCFYMYGRNVDLQNDFYWSDHTELVHVDKDIQTALFAYTENYDLAYNFMKQRNMDMFFYKKIKMSDTEYEEFKKEWEGGHLDYCDFYTSKTDNEGIIKRTTVSVLVTTEEENIVENCYELANCIVEVGADIVDSEYFNLLNHNILKILAEYFFLDMKYYEDVTWGLSECIDELSYYCALFGYTYKEKIKS